jgi:hypothetical protein
VRAFVFRSPAIGFDLIQLDLRMQLVDKDPEKAIALFWAAINAGDRVDSALKDMAIVMKQQNRAQEAIEAIKSLRSRCSDQAQESLDNILLDLYKVHSSPSSFFASPASIETSCTRINRNTVFQIGTEFGRVLVSAMHRDAGDWMTKYRCSSKSCS